MDDIFYQMTDSIGTSGQPPPERFREVARPGYRLVSSLAMLDSDNTLPDEARIVTSPGLSCYPVPVPAGDSASSKNLC